MSFFFYLHDSFVILVYCACPTNLGSVCMMRASRQNLREAGRYGRCFHLHRRNLIRSCEFIWGKFQFLKKSACQRNMGKNIEGSAPTTSVQATVIFFQLSSSQFSRIFLQYRAVVFDHSRSFLTFRFWGSECELFIRFLMVVLARTVSKIFASSYYALQTFLALFRSLLTWQAHLYPL